MICHFGVQFDDLLDKPRFRAAHVLDRLTRHRVRREADEIAGMAGCKDDPDLTVGLHAADARAMPGARIEHDERPLSWVEFDPHRRQDANEAVIDGALELAPSHHQFEFEVQDVRNLLGGMFEVVVAALAQDVEEKDRALPRVDPIIDGVLEELKAGPRGWRCR